MTILAARDSQRTVFYVRFADGSTNWIHLDHLTGVSPEELRRAPLFKDWRSDGVEVPKPQPIPAFDYDMEDFWGAGW